LNGDGKIDARQWRTRESLWRTSSRAADSGRGCPFGCGLSFGLIHPRTGPFTGGYPDRVRAARGRWRTPV